MMMFGLVGLDWMGLDGRDACLFACHFDGLLRVVRMGYVIVAIEMLESNEDVELFC